MTSIHVFPCLSKTPLKVVSDISFLDLTTVVTFAGWLTSPCSVLTPQVRPGVSQVFP